MRINRRDEKNVAQGLTADDEALLRLAGIDPERGEALVEEKKEIPTIIIEQKTHQGQSLTLHEQAFIEAFEECIRAKYYVCEALVNHEVDRKKDLWDKAGDVVKDLEPLIYKKLEMNIWSTLGLVAGNLIITYIGEIRDAKKRSQAGRFVEAFKGPTFIDKSHVHEIGQAMLLRFRQQINQLTITLHQDNKIVLTPKDGVVVLARRIATRVCLHIMRDHDKTIRVGKEDQPLPLVNRCLKALYNCVDDGLDPFEHLPRPRDIEKVKGQWNVKALLERTGIRLVDAPFRFYTHQSSLDAGRRLFGRSELTTLVESYGFCTTTKTEADERQFEHNTLVKDPFAKPPATSSDLPVVSGNSFGTFAHKSGESVPAVVDERKSVTQESAPHTATTPLLATEPSKTSSKCCCVIL